eukprot:GHVU01069081.1.p2 GENE.GHVU01069081.1~~GHVU01069081.1.p2  ORF type:complete len:166 (-),score=7.83 GHVU01069081.1:158-655(-)
MSRQRLQQPQAPNGHHSSPTPSQSGGGSHGSTATGYAVSSGGASGSTQGSGSSTQAAAANSARPGQGQAFVSYPFRSGYSPSGQQQTAPFVGPTGTVLTYTQAPVSRQYVTSGAAPSGLPATPNSTYVCSSSSIVSIAAMLCGTRIGPPSSSSCRSQLLPTGGMV